MKKLLVAMILMVLINMGLGVVALAGEDPHPWSIKPGILLTESDK
ncbi:MAG: hypothetical protein K0R93_2399 [Anaerosolibacter sp.]|jgi:hypothetical protein|nr:hypothetical protein [Anaerosolibacter sp.]MDF2547501.1 hypothetical protein [Anaerosolibacter sp.]